ncbi:MAG TPA: copper homeostasis membrane protein CopD [Devosiaceae bacterium]|nr:copper homeostasis membrane protein CopD [Devosiaceae bacterium]
MDLADVLIACRFVHFAAALLLVGTGTFGLWLIPEDLRRATGPSLWRLLRVAAVLAILTTLLWLLLEAAELGDGWPSAIDPATLGAVLTMTSFGHVWIARLLLALLLAAAFALPGRARWAGVSLVGVLLLASLGLVGHAADKSGPLGDLQRLNHATHLLAAAGWVGALPPLWICLRRRRDKALVPAVAEMLQRFSISGHIAVALVLVTGLLDTQLILGRWPTDMSQPYQVLLAAKIALVALMVLIALANRYQVVPTLDADRPGALDRLIRGTVAEIVLSAGVVALVSAFGTLDPGV